uniref:B-cell receptor CD22 n=1 Tax=Monopterus albus TaxID=43700 RepID=A0A3Q3JR54_MONAL
MRTSRLFHEVTTYSTTPSALLILLSSASLVTPATEGSCIEIKCTVTRSLTDVGASWFWLKDAKYIDADKDYTGTVIYSTDQSQRPVSPDFKDRVKYIGYSLLKWKNDLCSILICNLKKSDSGPYSFRYVGQGDRKWITQKNVTLTVTENPCLITFNKPSVIKESDNVELTCSTLSSCPSNPQIEDLTQLTSTRVSDTQQHNETPKSTRPEDRGSYTCKASNAVGFRTSEPLTVDVQCKFHTSFYCMCQRVDHGRESEINPHTKSYFSFPDGPRNTAIANKESLKVKVGQSLTLTCNTDANPAPQSYSWGSENKNKQQTFTTTKENFLQLNNVQRADEACYTCNASNAISRGHDSERACIHVLCKSQLDVEYWIKSSSCHPAQSLAKRQHSPTHI